MNTTLKCRFCRYFIPGEYTDSVQRRLMMIHIEKEHFERVCKRE